MQYIKSILAIILLVVELPFIFLGFILSVIKVSTLAGFELQEIFSKWLNK